MKASWRFGTLISAVLACGPQVEGTSASADGSSSVGSSSGSSSASTGADETAGATGDPTEDTDPTGGPLSGLCEPAVMVVEPPPGSNCTPAEPQPGGMCHEIVELPLLESHASYFHLADLDGDGLQDIAMAGSGWLGTAMSIPGAWPDQVAVSMRSSGDGPGAAADLDGDGLPDVVIGRQPLRIYQGHGDGGFVGRMAMPVPEAVVHALASDLNGDGLDDLVVVHTGGAVSSLLNLGGSLSTRWLFSPGCVDAVAAVTGDFSGDGLGDLVIGAAGGNVTLLLGDGTGALVTDSGADGVVGSVAAMARVDVDGDGRDELAVADGTGGPIRVLSFDAGGPLLGPSIAVDGTPSVMVGADLDADGAGDLVAGFSDQDTITWISGTGAGTFAEPQSTEILAAAIDLEVIDMDDDGRLDLFVVGSTGIASRLMGAPGGGFDAAEIEAVPAVALDLTLADLGQDGQVEGIAVVEDRYAVLPSEGGGELGAPVYANLPDAHTDLRHVLSARLDDDDVMDVIIVGDEVTVMALRGDGQDGLTAGSSEVPGAEADLGNVSTGDFDEDGRPDIVVTQGSGLQVWHADGMGGLVAGSVVTAISSKPTLSAVADLDLDGHDDVVWVEPLGSWIRAALGDGNGGFGGVLTSNVAGETRGVVLGDVNEDGVVDVVTELEDDIALAVGQGDGTFGPAQILAVTRSRPMLADFNGDGHLDLGGYHWLGNAAEVIMGVGDGTFTDAATYATDFLDLTPRAADFNGDGLADAVLRGTETHLRLLMSNPCGCGG